MSRDSRYETVRKLITSGQLDNFREIVSIVPKTVIRKDLGMHHKTFDSLLNNPTKFTFANAFRLASLIQVEEMDIITVLYRQCVIDRKISKRKKIS
ncbi:MAG TPA: hypothetical protein VGZ71_06340 [Puia sp.]|nr:hypothetical protein [Puia sp.]